MINEITNDDMIFGAENDNGFIEYKRSIIDSTNKKIFKYASQMRWRITENSDLFAIYYIGVADDGSIIGIDDINGTINILNRVAAEINANIFKLDIINILSKKILRAYIELNDEVDQFLVVSNWI
jgi:GTPase